MADSKFLKWQDKDGDGLVDVCDELDIEEVNNCPSCLKNPAAIIPNWLTLTRSEPFLNERTCKYQVTIRTRYKTTINETLLEEDAVTPITSEKAASAIDERYEEYSTEAIEALLDYYEKDDSDSSVLAIKAVIEHTEYDLDPRPKSRLKLLYSVPYDDLNALEDASDEEEEEDEGEEVEATYEPADLELKLIRLRKTLNLYNRYLKVYRGLDGGNLYFLESDTSPGNIFNLGDYGDLGFRNNSITANLLPQLDTFLRQKGYDLPGVGNPFKAIGKDKVQKLEFKFSKEYELEKLTIYTVDCKEKPIIFKKKLKTLLSQSAWKDKTAGAYLAQLEDILQDVKARETRPWLETIEEYTYPKIYSSVNAGYENTDPANSAGSCIAASLAEEGKQFGQDILDDVFSIGDAIAARFNKNLCLDNLEELAELKVKMGEVYDPKYDEEGNVISTHTPAGAYAKEQAYGVIFGEDSPCQIVWPLLLIAYGYPIKELWKQTFDPIKICGLLDLLLEGVQCLFKGLSLEDALKRMLKSALTAMSLEYFGDLFIGLPPEKQAELDALVQKKLAEGPASTEPKGAEASDIGDYVGNLAAEEEDEEEADSAPLWGGMTSQVGDTGMTFMEYYVVEKPWLNAEALEAEKNANSEEQPVDNTLSPDHTKDIVVGEVPTYQQSEEAQAKQQAGIAASTLSPGVIMEAYVLALLELYNDDLLGLTDMLNKFPGAQIIANVIAMFRCPTPPVRPNVMDFIKSIEWPFCRNQTEIALPKLFDISVVMANLADLWKALWNLIKLELQKLYLTILIKLMVKICELIGNAICKALETVGDLAASLPAMVTGRTTFSDVIRESICGDDADEEQINDTIIDMVSTLGVGGAAFADTEQTLSFAEDISAATTRTELMEAFLGKPSNDFLTIIDEIIEFEYPDYQDALSNKTKIGSMFRNMGNLMPLEFKDQMRGAIEAMGDDAAMPANPSLCATPQDLENFENLRCELLSGRATEEQCKQLFNNMQGRKLDDLGQLGDVLQGGIPKYIEDNMPPLTSAPGCDDGLIPYESDEQIAVATAALGNGLEQLKMDYSYDMLGNGPGEDNWGFINMILCDTMGNPYTAHQRKAFFRNRKYVDFYVDLDSDNGDDDDDIGKFAKIKKQKGAYPLRIAGWLEDYLQTIAQAGVTFISNNETEGEEVFRRDFDSFGISNFRGSPQHLLLLPDMGYNVTRTVDMETDQVVFTREPRKGAPDLSLSFYDNSGGRDMAYSYGFNLNLYLSDTYQSGSTYVNRFSDNARIMLTNKLNTANVPTIGAIYKSDDDDEESNDSEDVIQNRVFEFLGVDDTLSELDTSNYTDFLSTFVMQQNYAPQVVLLKEIIQEQGGSVTLSQMKDEYDSIMSTITTQFITTISENSASFNYGAVFDNLTPDDIKYVVEEGQTESSAGTEYFEAEVDDGDGGTRGIKNDDLIMGISNMQYEQGEDVNRVFYLDPLQYGGNYMNPPLYIKPLKNKGWLGFIDVMFPELSPCKPFRTDLVDFEDIDKKIDEVYPNLAEDQRLLGDPDCVIEKPYNRILERASAAGIQGLITAAIRIYVSTHFMKSLATFTKFYPKFPETFSSLYASYIVERMEESFKDAQKGRWEFFNPFKDQEFWYAFLEQSVQMWARRVEDGDIEFPSPVALAACAALNEMQVDYNYPDRQDLREAKGLSDIAVAAVVGAAVAPGVGAAVGATAAARAGTVSIFKTLKNYRSEKNLEAVQETEDYAKLVLKELVMEQLEFMGEKFITNLEQVGMTPDIHNLDYFLLTDLAQGGIDLDLNKEIAEEVVDFTDEEADELYTGGGEFYISEKNDEEAEFEQGDEYIGYYHAVKDEEAVLQYMAGEFHTELPQDILTPFASKVIVPIGDIEEFPYTAGVDPEKPFVIEKYISINDTRWNPSDAITEIKSNNNDLLISEVYPGTMKVVTDSKGDPVGVEGELGVRYGLLFSIMLGGTKYEIAAAEIDALDLTIGQIAPFDGDSKMLLCVINLLTQENTFKLTSRYIFPLPKITAMMAIYNDFAFLPSIGQITIPKGENTTDTIEDKPGSYVASVDENGNPVLETGQDGWVNYEDRPTFNGLFVLGWDDWDKQLLQNSKSRIKKIFKNYYNVRDFGDEEDDGDRPGKAFLEELRSRFKPAAGRRLLPWWKKRMLRTNPFNESGELCEKE
jgi:hypothetical protein